jgi:hypothetical protein|tara:strand:+ start:50 stop:952 length:903 start_codon:yes stop_codon:yes gene_type:complete
MENLLLLILIIALFIFFSKKFTENFTLFHDDNNKNIFAKYYVNHKFNFDNKYVIDSHPSNDLNFINSNNDSYEYNDSMFKEKLYKILEINNNLKILFKITENIKWSIWKNPDKCNEIIYKKFIKFLNIILKENSLNNIYHTLNKYKVNINNSNNLLFNIDLLLYRNNKIHGKHVNLILYYNNDKFYIIYLNIIGSVNQYDIINNTFLKDINYDNVVSYHNKKSILDDCNKTCDNQTDISDTYVDNKISDILIKKINTPYYNKNDTKSILKNKKYNEDQLYVKNFFMKNISENNTIKPHNF